MKITQKIIFQALYFYNNPFNSYNDKSDNNFYSKGLNNNFDDTSDFKSDLFGNKGKNEYNDNKKF